MIKGTICPSGYTDDSGDTKGSLDRCFNNCSKKCIPEPILNAIFNTLKHDHHKGHYISVTSLQNCLKSTWLERTSDYWIEPGQRQYQALRGSLVHGTLENQNKDTYLIETDFYYNFKHPKTKETVTLFGRVDLFDKIIGKITDFKTIKDDGFDYILRAGAAKEDHIWQTNCYKFLLEKGNIKPRRFSQLELFKLKDIQKPFKVNEIEIIYMCMKNTTQTGVLFKRLEKGFLNEYKIDKVPLYSNKEIKQYIEDRIFTLYDGFKYGVEPPEPDEQTQRWMCGKSYPNGHGFCTVRHNCLFWQKLAKENKWEV